MRPLPRAATLLFPLRYSNFSRIKVKIPDIPCLMAGANSAGDLVREEPIGDGGRLHLSLSAARYFPPPPRPHPGRRPLLDSSSSSKQRHQEGSPPVLLFPFQTHMVAQIPTGFHGYLAPPSQFLTQCNSRAGSGNSFSGLSRTPPSVPDRVGGGGGGERRRAASVRTATLL